MSLQDHWKRSGEALFRWRSYPPVLLALLVVSAAFVPARIELRAHRLHEFWELICLAIGLSGVLVRSLVVGFAPPGTSGRNRHSQIAAVCNQTAMYSVVRHPLYLGNLLMWLGPVLVLRSPWATVVMLLGFWLYYERIMFAEEDFLRARFGIEWSEWAARTPAFLPRWSLWRPSALPFSLRNVLKQEYSGLFALAVGFVFADWVDDYVSFHDLTPGRRRGRRAGRRGPGAGGPPHAAQAHPPARGRGAVTAGGGRAVSGL
jgi:protein-S-isoprenylcysteine O-methyltransferase Ste14